MIPNLYYYRAPESRDERTIEADVCIFGGNAAGVVAALQLSRDGKSAVILEMNEHLGGLTTGGLSETDFGNKGAIGGISRDFYKALGAHYGVDEEWHFEPHVAERIMNEWREQSGAPVYFREFIESVAMDGDRIVSVTTESGLTVRAKYFIDCSYEGDLMARAGVSYHVGRESNETYGETLNGVQVHPKHQFRFPVDPYIVEGDPGSGLLPGIEDSGPLPIGSGDMRVQAYNFRLILTQKAENRIPWWKPESYDPQQYELLARYIKAGGIDDIYGKFDKLRGEKVDKNNHGAISTDFIGQNFNFPEGTYAEREAIFQAHVQWHLGFFWFLVSDERVPQDAREWSASWGLCKDEYVATGGFSQQLYIRESRRMIGDYVAIEADCTRQRVPEDSVGLGAYTMDSHNCRRFVTDEGKVLNEGDVQVPPTGPYPISYRSIVPRRGECANLFVPVCLSASHIAYGSIRMEPVFMIMGQSAALAASIALDGNIAVQDVAYEKLRPRLEAANQVLSWND